MPEELWTIPVRVSGHIELLSNSAILADVGLDRDEGRLSWLVLEGVLALLLHLVELILVVERVVEDRAI